MLLVTRFKRTVLSQVLFGDVPVLDLRVVGSQFVDTVSGRLLSVSGSPIVDSGVRVHGEPTVLLQGGAMYSVGVSDGVCSFGTGNFAIVAYIRLHPTASGVYQPILEARTRADYLPFVLGCYEVGGSYKLDFVYGAGRITGSQALTRGVTYRVSVERKDGMLRLRINDTIDGQMSMSAPVDAMASTMLIGRVVDPHSFNGYIGSVQVYKTSLSVVGPYVPAVGETYVAGAGLWGSVLSNGNETSNWKVYATADDVQVVQANSSSVWKVFDNTDATAWMSDDRVKVSEPLMYDSVVIESKMGQRVLSLFSVRTWNELSDPSEVRVMGSNDGVEWEVVDDWHKPSFYYYTSSGNVVGYYTRSVPGGPSKPYGMFRVDMRYQYVNNGYNVRYNGIRGIRMQ